MLNVFHSQDLRMRSRASFFKGTGALGTLFGYNFVPSSLPTRMRHGGEDSGEIEFLDLILDIRLDMRMLFPYSAKLN